MDFSDLDTRVRKCLRARAKTVGAYLQHADEDDLVGECLLSIWRQVSAKEYTAAGVRSLIWLTCRSALADHAEAGSSRIVDLSEDLDLEAACDPEPVEHPEDQELPVWCLQLAGDLAPTAVALVGCESKADVAEIVGCGRSTVYSRVKKLRERFASVDPDAVVPAGSVCATLEHTEPEAEPVVKLAPEPKRPRRRRPAYRQPWQPLEKWEPAPIAIVASVEPCVPLWSVSQPVGVFGRDSGPVAARQKRGLSAIESCTARPPPAACFSVSA